MESISGSVVPLAVFLNFICNEHESWNQMKSKVVVGLLSAAVESESGYVVTSFYNDPCLVQSINDPTCSFDAPRSVASCCK